MLQKICIDERLTSTFPMAGSQVDASTGVTCLFPKTSSYQWDDVLTNLQKISKNYSIRQSTFISTDTADLISKCLKMYINSEEVVQPMSSAFLNTNNTQRHTIIYSDKMKKFRELLAKELTESGDIRTKFGMQKNCTGSQKDLIDTINLYLDYIAGVKGPIVYTDCKSITAVSGTRYNKHDHKDTTRILDCIALMSANKELASYYMNFFSALDLNKNFPHEQINSKPVPFDAEILFYMLNTSIGVANEMMGECRTHSARV